ncbi:hypothetical protein Tco_0836838 [Tanacetum coccineum]
MKTLAKCYFGVIEKDLAPKYSLSARQVAILSCIRAPHAQDFLFTIPIDGLGQRMNHRQFRSVLCYRLAIPMFSEGSMCLSCNVHRMDQWGDHAVHCSSEVGVKFRHNLVHDILVDICSKVGIMVRKEAPIGFLSEDGRDLPPADLLLFNWIQGKDVCLDVTCISPFTGTGVNSWAPGVALHNAVEKKKRKYATKCADNGYKFIPFAFSTFGEFDKDALDTLSRIRSLSISHSNNVKSGAFIFHRALFGVCMLHNGSSGCVRVPRMAPLVSTKFVLGLVACQVSSRVGPSSDLDTGSCTRAREVVMFCTIKSRPLALPWGRTPRLSSGVRVSTHVCQRMSECLVLGFPSISVTLVVVGVGPLSGKGPRIIVFADTSVLPRITSLKCVLTQEHLNAVCAKYFVPEEVHPQLPNSDATMHERPAGKVGMYTRFFDYANYRIPFSNFFVSVLTHFRIPFSQLSVFGSAKVSHFEILCRVCNIEPDVSLFRYFYTHNYKNGWFGFTKRPNVRACYSKNLDSVKNWNDHFFWVDEFVVPANARFKWFSGSTIAKDRAPAPSEYDIGHVNTLIAHASPFLRFPEEFLCWVGISRNYLLNKDTYPRFEYEDGEEMDLNAFIRTADPRKVKIVERARVENEVPIVTVAKHRTVTLLPTSVPRTSGELSASVEREFAGDASIGDGVDQGVDSVAGGDYAGTSVPVTEPIVADIPRPKRSKKKRVVYDSEPSLPIHQKILKGRITGISVRSPLEVSYLVLLTGLLGNFSITRLNRVFPLLSYLTLYYFSVKASPWRRVGIVRNLDDRGPPCEYRGNGNLRGGEEFFAVGKDREIEDLKSQLLKAKEESAEVTRLRAQVSGFEATESSLRGEVASAHDQNVVFERECTSLQLKVAGLESIIAGKDQELSDLGASSSSLRSENQSLLDQVHKLELSSADLRLKLETYEGVLAQLEEFQDNLMGPLRTRLAEIDADFTRCCMRFQESFIHASP